MVDDKQAHTEQSTKGLSEVKYRQFIDNAIDAIVVVQDGVIKFSNPATLYLTGYTTQKLASMPFVKLVHPDHVDSAVEKYTGCLLGKKAPNTYSFKLVTKAKTEIWVQSN